MAETGEPTFESTDVLRMFPSFVWKANLAPGIGRPLNETISRRLVELGAPLEGLAHGASWQSGHGLHEEVGFSGLVAYLEMAAQRVLDYLEVHHEGFRITGCWANVNAPGAGHSAHTHPNNYLSGVYYVQTAHGADTINFHDPRPQSGIIRPPVRALTAENTDQVVVSVTDGMVLLFPAWLEHSVDPNRSGTTRISLGFNIMFGAYAEAMGRPMWQPGRRR